MSDTPQKPEENASDEIEELQQDENLTPADRMDLIANAVAKDENPDLTAGDLEAAEDEGARGGDSR
jgi:hypothetical protein